MIEILLFLSFVIGIAKYTTVAPELNATQWVTHVLRNEVDRNASVASMECIRDMSTSAPVHGNAFALQNTVELVTWKLTALPTDAGVQLAGMEALNALCGSTTCNAASASSGSSSSSVVGGGVSVVDPEICQKVVTSGGIALAQKILKEHLIAPETSELNETNAAVQATLVLESVASCTATGLDAETMRQVLDMATAHLFEDNSTLSSNLKLQLLGAVCSIHSQSVKLDAQTALDMDAKGVVNKIIVCIARDSNSDSGSSTLQSSSSSSTSCGYVKDAVLMRNVISMMTSIALVLPEGQKANLKGNIALDLISDAGTFSYFFNTLLPTSMHGVLIVMTLFFPTFLQLGFTRIWQTNQLLEC